MRGWKPVRCRMMESTASPCTMPNTRQRAAAFSVCGVGQCGICRSGLSAVRFPRCETSGDAWIGVAAGGNRGSGQCPLVAVGLAEKRYVEWASALCRNLRGEPSYSEKPGSRSRICRPGAVAVNGRLATPFEEDRYRLPVAPGSKLRFLEVFCRALFGSPLDVAMIIRNEKGGTRWRAQGGGWPRYARSTSGIHRAFQCKCDSSWSAGYPEAGVALPPGSID